jgi:ABC-type transport system involved in multi-copper enzyme maturation permease subunit
MSGTSVIARLTFKEAARRRILLAAVALGLAFVFIFSLGFYFINRDLAQSMGPRQLIEMNEVRNFLLLAGLYVANFLTIMMTVLTSVDTLSGEIASGTIHTLVSKPLRRWEVVLGKWLGFAGMLTIYLLLIAGGIMASVYLLSGYSAYQWWRALVLMELNSLMLLSISLLGGANFSTLANGVLIFGMYGVAFIGGWIEQIGALMHSANPAASQTAINIGIITSLILPSEALWRRAAYEIQSPLVATVGFSPFGSNSVPSPLMVGYAVLYLLVAFWLAVWCFNRKDL